MKNQQPRTFSFFAGLLSLICLAPLTHQADASQLFNHEGMLIVDGQPLFVLGLYENPNDDALLKEAVEAGFNLVQCDASVEAFDRVERAGAKAWLNLGDALDLSRDMTKRTERLAELVQRVGHHPALLAWEGPDEILWNNWWVTMDDGEDPSRIGDDAENCGRQGGTGGAATACPGFVRTGSLCGL